MAYENFPHHKIDLKRLHDRLFNELGMEPLLITQQQDLIDIILTSIPDNENRVMIFDPVTNEPVARMVAIPLFSNS